MNRGDRRPERDGVVRALIAVMETEPQPFTKLVAGVDLSESSLAAVGQAMSLARHVGAPLVLMLVEAIPDVPADLPPSMRVSAAKLHGVLRERLAVDRTALEALRQRLVGQGVEVSHMINDGFADTALADGASKIGADLVVVGTHGRTGVRRVLLGSVAEKTVRLASSSVLVVRGDAAAAEGGYRRIVVGTDFSPLAEQALSRAIMVAAPGAVIEVVHAWHVPVDLSPEGSMAMALADLRDDLVADVARTGAELLARWRDRGVKLDFTAIEGPSRVTLCERAEAVSADLVVVGSHGRRGLRRMILGSVAEATVRHAPCSVMVAR